VYVDGEAERKVILEAYGMVDRSSPAYEGLNAYFRANDPFSRAKEETVVLHVSSVLPISHATWRVEWTEEVHERDGSTGTTSAWRATITIAIHPPSDSNTILVNPTGLYLTDFAWSKAQ
jgi:type IV secretion system protein VirB5